MGSCRSGSWDHIGMELKLDSMRGEWQQDLLF